MANGGTRGCAQCSRFWGETAFSSFSAKSASGQTCGHEREISQSTTKLREKKALKSCKNSDQRTEDTQAARRDQTWPRWAQGSAGALPSCSAWLTGAGTGPVTIRIQSSWCSCSVHTKSQGQPILRMGKLRGREWNPVQSKDSIPEPGCPTRRPAVPGGQTGAGSTDSTVHGLGPQGGLEASLCLVQGLLTTPFQP